MKFKVSSSELLNHLTSVEKVIATKNPLPILDDFLFQIEGTKLTVTASDLETTIITSLDITDVDGAGEVAVPAKLLTSTLKECPEQPIEFDIRNDDADSSSFKIYLLTSSGKFDFQGLNGEDFPSLPEIKDEHTDVAVSHEVLLSGLTKTLFATADDDLRPVMNGVFFDMKDNELTFVASDAHKLVRYIRTDVQIQGAASFILPKKPATLLKGLLPKEEFDIKISFDDKNAFFTLSGTKVICRLLEGKYPNYNAVIPKGDGHSTVTIDRIELSNALRRVSIFTGPSQLVKMHFESSELTVSAADNDFGNSGEEKLACQFESSVDQLEMGFKSSFLQEIVNNISTTNVCCNLYDASRAGLFLPDTKEFEHEDLLMLLMPMMINS
ncbi:MAG: DNA polymerase III subunit beta [Bacteroidales bacterium]|jgi:DNA polymerase-3 subunit beta|nr:DNA polymerase III subunit beta [Bacteroidales bacterium]